LGQSMLNFVKYFVQCHPRFRSIWNRHLKTLLFLFVVFLIVFAIRDWNDDVTGATNNAHDVIISKDDQLTAMKAQLGYLKRKFAESTGNPVDVNDASMPVIYAVTPTYARPVQKAELTRLCHAFLLVPNLHWVVVEDSKVKTELVTRLLKGCGIPHAHLNVQTPPEQKLAEHEKNWMKPRGVLQRNEALEWLRDHARDKVGGGSVNGVIYFADDDNTYDVRVFEEMRHTQGVSVWPVGLVGGLMVEKPKVGLDPEGNNKKVGVVGWDVAWGPERPFAIDMAGFAVNYDLFLNRPKAKFAYQVKRGYQETEFLRHLVSDLSELEPRADMCTKVYVWHTRTTRPDLKLETKRQSLLLPPSNKDIEV